MTKFTIQNGDRTAILCKDGRFRFPHEATGKVRVWKTAAGAEAYKAACAANSTAAERWTVTGAR